MSLVGELIDRTFRTYLEPPDLQPAICLLATGIDAVTGTVIMGPFTLPEDEELMAAGMVFEIGQELFLTTAYDPGTTTATVVREYLGTMAVAHTAGDPIKLSPPYPRMSVFEAIADNIITLYPDLWTVNTVNASGIDNIVPLDDNLAVDLIAVWSDTGAYDLGGRLVDFHQSVGGRAVVLDYPLGDVWVKYRRRFGVAETEADDLETLGVHPRWENIVMLGACADLFMGRDLPSSHTEWVGASLEAQAVPLGTRASIAGALTRYRELLIDRAKREMRSEYGARMTRRLAVNDRW